MTHDELVVRANKWLKSRADIITSEASPWFTKEIPDALGWDSRGESTLIECKVSYADFMRDRAITVELYGMLYLPLPDFLQLKLSSHHTALYLK